MIRRSLGIHYVIQINWIEDLVKGPCCTGSALDWDRKKYCFQGGLFSIQNIHCRNKWTERKQKWKQQTMWAMFWCVHQRQCRPREVKYTLQSIVASVGQWCNKYNDILTAKIIHL